MQEDCHKGDSVKVLTSTIKVFIEGHKLQRVKICIITEVSGSYEKQKQAVGRVDRTGQAMRPMLFQLVDNENASERVRMLQIGIEGNSLHKAATRMTTKGIKTLTSSFPPPEHRILPRTSIR